MKKVLVYSHDAYGLGNIRRMLEITTHLVNTDPDVSVLLISGSPMMHAFRIPDRVDYIKLPCVARSEKGETSVKTLGLDYESTIRMRSNMIMMAALDFGPDLVLVDKKPFGIEDELEPTLTVLRKRANAPKMVLLLRDILDHPSRTIGQWNKGKYHQAIRAHYDRVLIVGEPEVFDAVTEYEFPDTTAAKVRYCGYIERPRPRKPAVQVRAELGIGDSPMVLVTAGGGGDGYDMMYTYLLGLEAQTDRRFKTLLVSGPEMSAEQREMIAAQSARCGDVIFREFTDDMMSCMNAADVVISMGGYNTVCEMLTLRKPAIIVPRVKPVQEQWVRAERMQRMGLLQAIHPDCLTPEGLMEAVRNGLESSTVCRPALEAFALDGLERIGMECRNLLATREIRTSHIGGDVERPVMTLESIFGALVARFDAAHPYSSLAS